VSSRLGLSGVGVPGMPTRFGLGSATRADGLAAGDAAAPVRATADAMAARAARPARQPLRRKREGWRRDLPGRCTEFSDLCPTEETGMSH
jgi:hypothetical protein